MSIHPRNRGDWRLPFVAGGYFLFMPVRAEAHAVIRGMDEFVGGLLHPLLTPPHLLVLLGMGLLLGQRASYRLAPAGGVFAAFAATGLLVTATGVVSGIPQPVLIGLGLCAGGLVALAFPLPVWARWTACAAAGFALGLDSGVDPGTPGIAAAKTLSATWLSLTLCVVNVAHYSARLPARQWVQTGVRIAGSWIVAVGILMLAFSLRSRGAPLSSLGTPFPVGIDHLSILRGARGTTDTLSS